MKSQVSERQVRRKLIEGYVTVGSDCTPFECLVYTQFKCVLDT